MRDKILQMVGWLVLPLTVACATPRGATPQAAGSKGQDTLQAIRFSLNQSTIREQDQPVLEQVSSRLQQDQKSVAILEGHTCDLGEAAYNEQLGEERARAVRSSLYEKGIDPRRLIIVSKGEGDPRVPGMTKKAREANRRVEIRFELTDRREGL